MGKQPRFKKEGKNPLPSTVPLKGKALQTVTTLKIFQEHIWDQKFVFIFGLGIFLYTCLRAHVISISHDEALTYLLHVPKSIKNVLFDIEGLASNNHFLNTILIKISVSLFGNTEFVLRIPALMGHGIYLIAIWKILKLFSRDKRLILGFILLSSNPFLIDFFSCARGYSLGVGFSMLSLLYFFKRIRAEEDLEKTKFNYFTMIYATLSVFSNLSFANVFVSVICLLSIFEIRDNALWSQNTILLRGRLIFIRLILPLFFCLFALGIIYNPFMIDRIMLNVSGFGGKRGLWADTAMSLLDYNLYGVNYYKSIFIWSFKIFIPSLLTTAIILTVYVSVKKRTEAVHLYIPLMTLILFCMIILIELQHVLFNIDYATDRAVIYLIPPFYILALLSWEFLHKINHKYITKPVGFALSIFMGALIIHNILCFNITHYFYWKYDANTKDAMNLIYDMTGDENKIRNRYKIGVNWLFEPSTNYYISKKGMYWVNPTTREGPQGIYDFYYLAETNKEIVKQYSLKIVKLFSVANSTLAIPP